MPFPSKMEELEEQRPLSPACRESDDKIHNFKSAPNFTSYPDRFIYWPKASAGYEELARKRLKLDKESVLRTIPKPGRESQKIDANEVLLLMMVKEKLQKKELWRKRYASKIETESESDSDSDSESGSGSDNESDRDSDSYSYSDSDWEWVHYYDFELYPEG